MADEPARPNAHAAIVGSDSHGPRQPRAAVWGIVFLLSVVTLAVFGRAVVEGFDFLYYDDHEYVFKNPQVVEGLTWQAARWAFRPTTRVASNWHPLTMLSHMLDCSIYGLRAWGHHLTNILWHLANVLLLFTWLRRMTGALWPCALVAALFAWHPLHVESVAWIAERKDVLSTFFWLVGCLVYTEYSRRPGPWRYLAVCLALLLGLLCKPMVVTFPFALMLLDYWPLGRYSAIPAGWRAAASRFARLAAEKLPMLLLVAAASLVTLEAQSQSKMSLEYVTAGQRLINAALSYDRYLAKTVWPAGLATPYLLEPDELAAADGIIAAVPLVLVSGLAIALARRLPYLFVGWCWFLGTLVPVIGLVQVGVQSMADRYTYIPLLGPFIAVAWGLADLVGAWPLVRRPVAAGVVAALVLLAAVAFRQVGYWRDTVALLRHTLVVTGENYVARLGLGAALRAEQRYDEALVELDAVTRSKPDFHPAYYQRALVRMKLGDHARAARDFAEGVRLGHGQIERRQETMMAMAAARVFATDPQENHRDVAIAIEMAEHACRLTGSRSAEPLDALAAAYAEAGRFSEAIARATMARQIALRSGKHDLARRIDQRIELYRRRQPYREDPANSRF